MDPPDYHILSDEDWERLRDSQPDPMVADFARRLREGDMDFVLAIVIIIAAQLSVICREDLEIAALVCARDDDVAVYRALRGLYAKILGRLVELEGELARILG